MASGKDKSGVQSQLQKVVNVFVTKLKRREIRGSSAGANDTLALLRNVIAKTPFSTAQELLDILRSVGRSLMTGNPNELAIGNIVRRVMFIVRQECVQLLWEQKIGAGAAEKKGEVDLSMSLHKLLDDPANDFDLSSTITGEVRKEIVQRLEDELMDEITSSSRAIADQAVEHIHAQETILTFGISKTVVEFLQAAANLRKFDVIVAESAPSYSGHKMAAQLSQMGIDTTVITDSAVFALMSAVNKVIIGTHAVVANGGLIAHTGAHNIAVAAKAHSIPVVVLSPLYKLCPLYAFDQDTINEQNPPSDVIRFDEEIIDKLHVENPAFDYIPPELISLFITNVGGHNPSYIYRLLAEYYDPQDYEL